MTMRFSKRLGDDPPEINFIALIDVLLVILIFMMVTTTFSRFTELEITLPSANAELLKVRPKEMVVLVSADGRYSIDGQLVTSRDAVDLAHTMARMIADESEIVLVLSADAQASHQSVVTVLEAAKLVGVSLLTIATQFQAGR